MAEGQKKMNKSWYVALVVVAVAAAWYLVGFAAIATR
jgi:hypothetical protein